MTSYLKFLWRNRLYTFIEVVGLALSLTFVVFVGSYASQQYSVAHAHPDADRIYIPSMQDYPGLTSGLEGVIRERFPEIEQITVYFPSNIAPGGGRVVEIDKHKVEIQSEVTVDEHFFEMFPDSEFLMGSPDVLKEKDNVIVSEKLARKLFPDGNFRSVLLDEHMNLAAVIADNDRSIFPEADVIMSKDSPLSAVTYYDPFDNFGTCQTFVKLRKGSDVGQFYENMKRVCKEIYPTAYGTAFFKGLKLRRWDKVFFEPSDGVFRYSDPKLIYTLSAIALLLLLSSVANFVNLNTALVGQRAKEMATRRLLGASSWGIRGRYVFESVALTAVAMIFALLVAEWLAPWMNEMIEADVPVRISFSAGYMMSYVALVVVVGALGGLLPAVLASRYRPIDIVRGTFRRESKRIWSKIFIVIQMAVSVFLISMAFVMHAQYRKSLNREMNCNLKNKFALLYMIPVSDGAFDLEARIREMPQVKRVGRAMNVPCTQAGVQYSMTTTGEEVRYRMYIMDSTTFNMMEFPKEEDFRTPAQKSVWFSESAFRATGFDAQNHDISTTLAQKSGACDHTAGVIGDVPTNIENIGAEELMIVAVQDFSQYPLFMSVIETTDQHEEFRKALDEICREYCAKTYGYEVEPMYCDYLEDLKHKALAKAEKQMNLVYVFMTLAVLISMLGLLAMSIYDARNRAKDIAVRKVFGSTAVIEARQGIFAYLRLIAVACAFGLVAAVMAAEAYLRQFVSKIENYGWIFLVVVVVIVAMAVLTTFWQIWMAARVNPVKTLNKE